MPLLIERGFSGPVLPSAATGDLAEILLPDSGRLQEEEASYAARHAQLRSLSAHADADQLIAWLAAATPEPAQIFMTHGEPNTADTLRRRIGTELGWNATVPEHLQEVNLS